MMTRIWYPLFLGVFIIMTTTSGCATGRMTEMRIPGNPNLNDYGINFEIDWDIFDLGTYRYDPRDTRKLRMGGGRLGYRDFYTLNMDFKFKDGREYHEKIDIRPLIQKMVKQYQIFDLTKTRRGGMATLIVRIERDRLAMEYEVIEYIKEETGYNRFLFKRYLYPVFEKKLD